MEKILTFLIVVAGIGLLLFVFQSYSPVKLTDMLGNSKDSPFSESACLRVVVVKGNGVEPLLKNGQTTTFNKCIEGQKENLKVGTIILLEQPFQPFELLVIRKKVGSGSATVYKASNNQTPSSTKDVPASEIKAVYKK